LQRPAKRQTKRLVEPEPVSRLPNAAPVPFTHSSRSTEVLGSEAALSVEETYGKDEQDLNEFLKLHPMLSHEACSARCMDAMGNLFHRSSIRADAQLPCVPKSYDDQFLRPANTRIGERNCVNEGRCMANVLASMRYGPESPLAFTCMEFLLPAERKRFLDGKGLPPRRGKCLLCTRYFQVIASPRECRPPGARWFLRMHPFANPARQHATAPPFAQRMPAQTPPRS
jgi:hypothetical protein